MRPASEAEKRRLNETFAWLCAIPSPFGSEGRCAEAVAGRLRDLGLDVSEDDAAAGSGAECGNLLARIAPRRADARWITLCAHLDTVAHDAPIEPVLNDTHWESAGDTILGADNKAAVAVLLEVARRATVEGTPVGIELLFTVSEENALAGVREFDASVLRSEWGYVFDHATPIGEIISAAPTAYKFRARFRGAAAHAGMHPELGRSAVQAAGRAVASMRLGRLDDETTANIASVHGGVPGTNVIPELCTLVGETRSLDAARAEASMAELIDRLQDAANSADCPCDLDVTTTRSYEGYRVSRTSPALRAAESALRACGFEPRARPSGGGSDANVLNAAGLPCVNIANGTEFPHEPTERVSVDALEHMLDVTLALLDACSA